MMRARLLFVLFALYSTGIAHATIGPPVRIRVLELPESPQVGSVASIRVAIDLMPGVQIDGLRIAGDSWSILDAGLPASMKTLTSESTEFTIRAIPSRLDAPLRMEYEVAGSAYATTIRLTPRIGGKSGRARQVRRLEPHEVVESTHPVRDWMLPEPTPIDEADSPESDNEEGFSQKAPRNIRVHGRFVYQRENPNLTTSTVGVDAMTFRVYDDDFVGRQLLANGLTDSDGNFDVTFYWNQCCEADPDLYIEFETSNTIVSVEEPVLGFNYVWVTGTTQNYSGTDLSYGSVQSIEEADQPAFHIHNTVMRTWRWIVVNEGYNTGHVNVQWPADWSTSFFGPFGDIHIVPEDQWMEKVIVHEYGHRWMSQFTTPAIPLYCNGFCDDSIPFECGHCLFCQENGTIAWQDGFSDWMGNFLPQTFLADYGLIANYWYSFETLLTCQEDDVFHLPNWTEGFFAAALQDIMDTSNEDDAYSAGIMDELAMGTDEIFEVAATDDPNDPMEFMQAFLARYNGVTSQLWATAKNNGYDLDNTPPPVPTGLYSTSHPVNVPEGDQTPTFFWDIPVDDISGVAGFSFCYSCTTPNMPDTVMDVGVQNFYVAPQTLPGTYYFNIRTVDRDGNWSPSYATYGPYIVDQPDPADLGFVLSGGWDGPVVPKSLNNATPASTHVDATLPGGGDTYWNIAYYNDGDVPTASGFDLGVSIDGGAPSMVPVGILLNGVATYSNNLGPITVKGGRHTLTGLLDANDVLAEPSETNNARGGQWSWTPTSLAGKTLPLSSSAPPDKTGGWSTVPGGVTLYDNCDGYRIPAVSEWHAVLAFPMDRIDDYDVRLHTYNAGTTGFDTPLHESARGGGLLDAVIVNRNQDPVGDEDISVVNGSGGFGDYMIDWVESTPMSIGPSELIDFAKNDMLAMRHIIVAPGQTGGLTIRARAQTGTDFGLRFYYYSFSTGTLDDTVFMASSDDKGYAQLEPIANIATSYAVVVFREPFAADPASSIRLDVQIRLPDLTDTTPGGWAGALVPLPSPSANQFSVPLPTSLNGNVNSTYFNFALLNDSTSNAGAFAMNLLVDGRITWIINSSGMGGMSTDRNNNWGPRVVAGGRHTLSMVLDDPDVVLESDEDNNSYGQQWVWSPVDMSQRQLATRAIPNNITSGWEHLIGGSTAYYNCDGLFMDDLGSTSQAIAVVPQAGLNVDLRLHEASTGPLSGFDATLARSSWGPGLSDFVIVNTAHTAPRGFDVGVVNGGALGGNYSAQAVAGTPLGTDPVGDFGPYPLGENEILYLFDMQMSIGHWGFEVIQGPGDDIDWGISIHENDNPYLSKSMTLPGGIAWGNPEGVSEFISFDILEPGVYCVGVWKAGAYSLPNPGTFTLRGYDLNTIDAPSPIPTKFALRGNVPNPFNPSTEIGFDLPLRERVRLSVYDATGRLVRTLVAGEAIPAGHHSRIWNGRDDAGRQVSSGVYFARLESRSAHATKKLTLVK